MTQTSARPPEVMRGQFRHTDPFRAILHNVPDRLFRHAVSPCPPHSGDPAKDSAPANSSRPRPTALSPSRGSEPFGRVLPCPVNRQSPSVLRVAVVINPQANG